MKNPISLAMPDAATFTAALVWAREETSERPTVAKARQVKARPAEAASKRDLETGLPISARSRGGRSWATMRHERVSVNDRGPGPGARASLDRPSPSPDNARLSGAFSGKVESGFPSENATMQKC